VKSVEEVVSVWRPKKFGTGALATRSAPSEKSSKGVNFSSSHEVKTNREERINNPQIFIFRINDFFF
jgi:hypothetical protein